MVPIMVDTSFQDIKIMDKVASEKSKEEKKNQEYYFAQLLKNAKKRLRHGTNSERGMLTF